MGVKIKNSFTDYVGVATVTLSFVLLLIAMTYPSSAIARREYVTLRVVVSGIKSDQGQLLVSVYDKKSKFLRDPYRHAKVELDDSEQAVVTFHHVEKGHYAISVVHDLNKNNKLDRDKLRNPKEPWAFSKGLRAKFRAPSYRDVMVNIAWEKTEVRVDMDAKAYRLDRDGVTFNW